MSFAKVTLVGRLGGDPEAKYTQNGALFVTFSLATDGRKKDGPPTWFRVSAWSDIAERIIGMQERGYIAKGRLLYVEGQLEQREYEHNGTTRTSLDVTMTDWRFIGSGQQDGGDRRDEARAAFNGAAQSASDMDEISF